MNRSEWRKNSVSVMSHTMSPKSSAPQQRYDPVAEEYRHGLHALRPHLAVVHHIPGRLRVQLRSGMEAARALGRVAPAGVESLARILPGMRSARINAMAGSLVLEYDPGRLVPEVLDAFFRVVSREEADSLLDRLLNTQHASTGERG